MFKQLLAVQWKWTKGAALLATVLGFLIPVASVESLASTPVYGESALGAVRTMQGFGVIYALLAAGAGLTFAILAWSQDHKGRHVYALSLPVRRSTYAAMRFGAGALLLTLPALGVLVGSLAALSVAHIPPGLHAYPIALALRFFLSSGVAFAVFFSIAASTPKTAGIILGAIALLFLTTALLSEFSTKVDLMSNVSSYLFEAPGLLAVFAGRWMLIDV